jgi:hypothetical protein
VRWAPATSGAVWADGVLVNPDGYPGDTSIGFGPLQTGTYMAKAWNGKTYSANAASVRRHRGARHRRPVDARDEDRVERVQRHQDLRRRGRHQRCR